jgi:hypothetical protein
VISITARPSRRRNDGLDCATHKMRHDGTPARAGDDGHVEIWAFGEWTRTDHRNSVLEQPGWFVRLPGTPPPAEPPDFLEWE